MQRQGPKLLEIVAACHEHGHDLRRFYQDLLLFSRHLLMAKLGPSARPLADLADQEWDYLHSLAQPVSLAHLFNLLSSLLRGEEELRRSPHPRLSLEILLLRLVSLEPLLDLPDWLQRLTALESRLGQQGDTIATMAAQEMPVLAPWPAMPEPSREEVTPPAVPPLEPATPEPSVDETRWQAFLAFLEAQDGGPLAGRLAGSRLVDQDDGLLRVAPTEAWRSAQPHHAEQLQALVQQFFGPRYRLEIELPPAPVSSVPETPAKRQLTFTELKPLALDIFGGQWLSGQDSVTTSQEEIQT